MSKTRICNCAKTSYRHKAHRPFVPCQVGDLVQLSGFWGRRVGIVQATSRAWHVIDNHYDVAGCIAHKDDVVKVIRRKVVPAKYMRYLI